MIGPHLEAENMVLSNLVEIAVVVAIVVVANRFFARRGSLITKLMVVTKAFPQRGAVRIMSIDAHSFNAINVGLQNRAQ